MIGEIVLIYVKSITNLGHVLQPIRCFTVAVGLFDPKTVKDDVNPAGEPAAGGLARMLPNACLAR
jgi:hypothetical protein